MVFVTHLGFNLHRPYYENKVFYDTINEKTVQRSSVSALAMDVYVIFVMIIDFVRGWL